VNNINRLLRDQRIIIHPRCKKLINDLEKVVWKNDELDQKTDKMLTHISDALGYLCWGIDPLSAPQQKSSTIQL
jgi:phage terminase large subunit